jgi:hypothetical protein
MRYALQFIEFTLILVDLLLQVLFVILDVNQFMLHVHKITFVSSASTADVRIILFENDGVRALGLIKNGVRLIGGKKLVLELDLLDNLMS